jgi:2-methylcitrate dehydratase PrpD
MEHLDLYRTALTDWLACAVAGRTQPAALAAGRAGDATASRIIAAATAGHVLDFDDTYLPGLVHLSAPTAPVAVVVGAARDATVGAVLRAYAAGFEAMAALAAASHPALYHRGWHPTAVCGVVGAAVVTANLLELDPETASYARNLAVLGAGGFRAAFGSDGKSLQVGLAAASGVQAAVLAGAGAHVPDSTLTGPASFEEVFGARWAEPGLGRPAVGDNWLKRYPCCLQTHGVIEAAVAARDRGASPTGRGRVTVHPISLAAAALGPDISTGLEAKFSIPYCTALAIVRGHPRLADFGEVDNEVRALARRIEVRTDRTLLESEAHLEWTHTDGTTTATRTTAAVGSPDHPMDEEQRRAKLADLGAEHLVDLVADLDADASELAALLR